jgi:hypothetical protein
MSRRVSRPGPRNCTMSDEPVLDPRRLPLPLAAEVDRVCGRLATEWAAGRRPSAEESVAGDAATLRAPLLAELLRVELEARRAAGEAPAPAEFRGRFPAATAAVEAAFQATTAGALATGRGAAIARDPGTGAGSTTDPARQAGLNLLFGILALQNNFIGRDPWSENTSGSTTATPWPACSTKARRASSSAPRSTRSWTRGRALSPPEPNPPGAGGTTSRGARDGPERDATAGPESAGEPPLDDHFQAWARSIGACTCRWSWTRSVNG